MRWLLSAPLVAALLSAGCGADSPADQVRRRIDDAEQAARARDVGALGAMVSEQYGDTSGYGKREVLALARYQFQQHRSVSTLKQIRAIRTVDSSTVEAEVLVAVADVALRDLRDLDSVSADLLLLRLRIVRETGGDWRVIEADWKEASPADFL
jgi:hypothetical protein